MSSWNLDVKLMNPDLFDRTADNGELDGEDAELRVCFHSNLKML